jgi:hypothetical protein
MVASISGSSGSGSGGISKWADAVFSKLDTKNQGYIEKSDLASALSATGDTESSDTSALDDMFSAVDGDSDGKVSKSELTEAMTRLSDQLNAQFDASRVQGGMPPGPPPSGSPPPGSSPDAGAADASATGGTPPQGGMQGAGGPRGGGGAGATESTDSTDYVAAADTDGDGTVSDAEQAAYDKKLASGEIDKNGNSTDKASAAGAGKPPEKDPVRELAQALHRLKAYAENGSSDASSASTAGVSVEA